jgi:hypothetical protein
MLFPLRVRHVSFLTLLCLTGLLTPTPVRGEERYYALIFGSQSVPKLPRYSHCWATMVRVTIDDCTRQAVRVEPFTISWMPASLEINPWRLCPEPGVNLGLHDTIRLMLHQREEVAVWGPYELPADSFARFIAQKAHLESGLVQYKCIDPLDRRSNVSDCIHAITDKDPIYNRWFYPVARFGEAASHHIVKQLYVRGRILNPGQNNDWLLGVLQLNSYPLVRREYVPGPLSSILNRGRMPYASP